MKTGLSVLPTLLGEYCGYLLHPAQNPSVRSQTARQIVCGGIATLCDIGVFQIFVLAGANPYLATGLGFFVGMLANFGLTRCYAFADRQAGHLGSDFLLYTVSTAVALCIAELCILAFHSLAGFSPLVSKLLSVPFVFAWSVLGARLIFHGKYRARRDELIAKRKNA